MGEKVDYESARRAAAAMARMLEFVERGRRKPGNNVIVLELNRKLGTPEPDRIELPRAAE